MLFSPTSVMSNNAISAIIASTRPPFWHLFPNWLSSCELMYSAHRRKDLWKFILVVKSRTGLGLINCFYCLFCVKIKKEIMSVYSMWKCFYFFELLHLVLTCGKKKLKKKKYQIKYNIPEWCPVCSYSVSHSCLRLVNLLMGRKNVILL